MLADPTTLSPHPGEIHGAGTSSTRLRRDPWRWHAGVAGEWTALLHLVRRPFLIPGGALSQPDDRAPPTRRPWCSSLPSPTVVTEASSVLVALVLVRLRSPRAPTPMAGIDRPRLPLLFVANVCFRCFSFLKVCCSYFFMDVAKVDRGMLHMLHMLLVFHKHVVSVCSKCFICFQTYIAIIFYLYVTYIFTHML
jgi:hypothetical protein